MKISVIIPIYNEAKDIVECLQSLDTQTYKDFEVVVVDDGSTDKTLQVLQNSQFSNLNFQLLRQKHQGPAIARNLGAQKATGKILVFVDADMTFDKKFLEKLTLPIRNGTSRGTFSKDEYVKNWDKIWARLWNKNDNLPNKRRLSKKYPNTQRVFRAISKPEFDKVKGFDKGGYTDDWTLSQKLGFQATVAADAFFYHKNPESISEVYRHSKWVGKRKYKLGLIGAFGTLFIHSPLIAFVVGILKAIVYREPWFVIFRLVYSLGIFVGILEMLVFKKLPK